MWNLNCWTKNTHKKVCSQYIGYLECISSHWCTPKAASVLLGVLSGSKNSVKPQELYWGQTRMLGNEAWLSVCITVYPKGEWIWGQGSAQVSQVFQQKEKKSLFFLSFLHIILRWLDFRGQDSHEPTSNKDFDLPAVKANCLPKIKKLIKCWWIGLVHFYHRFSTLPYSTDVA